MLRRLVVVAAVLGASGTAGTEGAEEARQPNAAQERRSAFTLGLVQRELRTGLSQAEVVQRLGSPNILTRDAAGREAWVYDRVSSELESSNEGFSIGGFGSGGGSSVGGALGIRAGRNKQKSVASQRTLTVVVRFSAAGVVETVSWHDTRF